MLDRRRFVGALTVSLAIARSVAQAQPAAKVYRVGFLLGATEQSVASLFNALKEGLRELGYAEGRNLVFEQRYAGGRMERLPELAAELARLRVDVIVTGTNLHVAAVRKATAAIPVVMVFVEDPVGSGFAASLSRPGGNITGLSAEASSELWGKYLTQLREIVPRLSRVGVIGQVASKVGFAELATASQKLEIALEVADLQSVGDLGGAFDAIVRKRVEALLLVVGPLTYQLMQPIAELAIKHRLPSISNAYQFTQAGFLMSYGPNLHDLYRQAASYVDKILRGAKPADLPIQQPSRYALTTNLKTAKAIGATIPHSMLLRAEEVIQ
jgi:putative tryptophan/tyrosine transport system substrate-binding protein